MKKTDIPTVEINATFFRQMAEIDDLIKKTEQFKDRKTVLRLRKESKIRSINSSLAIEGNDIGIAAVRDIINGKDVIGEFIDIVEVKNANKAYDTIGSIDLWSVEDLLSVHDDLMFGLVENIGFRRNGVGVYEGTDRLVYKAPDCEKVPELVEHLFEWGRSSKLPLPIVAAITHYYIEAIHPFEDGNGRIGRLWHTAILESYNPVFHLIPIESKIRSRQNDYYTALENCQKHNPQDCSEFVEFCLNVTISSLKDLLNLKKDNIERILSAMGDDPMSGQEIMALMKLSDRKHFREYYLKPAIEYGFIDMTIPDKPNSKNQRYGKILF